MEDNQTTLPPFPPSLEKLFQSDPLSLTDQDLDALVEEFRKRRGEFVMMEGKAKKAPKKTVSGPLDLKSLGL